MLFRFDNHNVNDAQNRFRGPTNGEYYGGEYVIERSGGVEVSAYKQSVGASSIIHLRSQSRMQFRRTRRHIREDGVDMTVLWFVDRGSLALTSGDGITRTARAGDFLLSRSTDPFLMKCSGNETQPLEVIHATIPTHIIRAFVADTVPTGFLVRARDSQIELARTILIRLLAQGPPPSRACTQRLFDAVLSLVADTVGRLSEIPPPKPGIAERRIDQILHFIDLHLCNPSLSTTMVCTGCGISPRYLGTLLQRHGTSFSTHVWDLRMAKAMEWLSLSRADQVSVGEIAFRLGFKSAAHFSRRFKLAYKRNPSTCRADHASGECTLGEVRELIGIV